jgi:hypothetical protein
MYSIYILRQSINGDDYLSGAVQRSSTVISHTQLSYGILCRIQHSWHPLWTNLNHWPKAITTNNKLQSVNKFLIFGIELQHDEFYIYIYIYILRQSINGDDYLSGAAQREQTNNL